MRERIILDNGGGITLQFGEYAHNYDDPRHAAVDIREWLKTGDTSQWDGHDEDALQCAPTGEDIRNGGYRVIDIDRSADTPNNLADEITQIANGWGNGKELAEALR